MLNTDIAKTVSQILKIALSRKQTIAAAESCTGGLLGVHLSDAPGSSNIFLGALIAYTEATKIYTLGVDEKIIRTYGVVSEQVAASMAKAALEKFKSDWAISTTGYSGPTGGTKEAPLGTVCVSVSGPMGTKTRKYILKNLSRRQHQEKSCELVFELLLKSLNNS